MGEMRTAYISVALPEGKRGSHTRRRECNIKINAKEMGCEGVDWIQLAVDRDQ
jgi:hypothetical protein